MTKFENEPITQVKVPLPRDQHGRVRNVTLNKLGMLIQKKVSLLTQHSRARVAAFNVQSVRDLPLRFVQDDVLVCLEIPVPPLLEQTNTPVGVRSAELFGRRDKDTLVAVQEHMDHVQQVGRDIQDLSCVLLTPNLTANEALHVLASTHNAAVRDFVATGDSLDVNVDQRPIALKVEASGKGLVLDEVTRIRVQLDRTDNQSVTKGKILEVLEGPLGVCYVGSTVPLGHVKNKPFEKACLHLAACLNVEVQVCVRVVVSKSRLRPLTAEVLAVENSSDILAAALQHQTEAATQSRGGTRSVVNGELDFEA